MSKLSYLIAIPAALVLATPGASASEDERVITAIGSRHHHPAWLSTYGPDADGAYTARIDISDLNLASSSGRDAMFVRVKSGVRKLCVRATYEPKGSQTYFQPGIAEVRCRSNALASAQPQMDRVIAATGRGERVAHLGVAIVPLRAR